MRAKKNINQLSTTDWKVYNLIKERSEKGEWIFMREIAEELGITKRTARQCVLNIRECETIQKIVISDYSKGYKLMSDEDSFDLLFKDKIRILKELKRYWKNVRRLSLNNQRKLTFDTKERDFFQSLIKG